MTGITPAIRYAGSAEVGKTGTFVGYGMRGTGLTGSMMSDELRRAGNNVLDMVGGTDPFAVLSDRILLADFDDPGDADGVNLMGSATLLPLEYSIAPGDSGGPVFVDFPDDGLGPILVGINSFNGAFGPEDTPPGDGDPNAEYGEFMGATRVGPFNDWIDAHMATVPEPGALGVLMVAGVLALRRRRSSR